VQIERGASNTLVVMARVTLSPSYWLLHFTDIERGGNAYCVVEPGNSGGAFISLTFTETTAPVALDGEVLLAPPGNWNVKIYEQTSSTNLVPASANRLVKDVDIFVVGDGVADGGWTETCPTDGDECDPLSLRVNGEPYASIADPCGAIATVEVEQDGTAVGSLVGGVWVIPTCDDLSYSLVNSNNDELDGGSVPDPCGEQLTLTAPDANIRTTDTLLNVAQVPSGNTYDLPQTSVMYANAFGVTQLFLTDTTFDGANLQTQDFILRADLRNSLGNVVGAAKVTAADLMNDTVPIAPDGIITFDGLSVGTVPSGDTENLDCGTLLNAAYVQDGGSVTGTYLVTGTLNSRNVYTLDVDHNLEYTGTRWRLVKPGSDVDAALGSQTFPWLADWSATSVTVEQATIGSYCGGDEVPCADLTIAINGTTYGTVADPCGATAAVNVHDTNGNDVGSLVSGSWVVANSIITKPDATTIGLAATASLDVRDYRSGIAYKFGTHLWNGQQTSYRTGDEGYYWTNGLYTYAEPVYPLTFARISDFSTMAANNVHGNTLRFTDRNGLAAATSGNRVVQDHLTGLEWYIPSSLPAATTWNSAIDAAESSTVESSSDWFLPNDRVLDTITDDSLSGPLNYGPFLIANDLWTSATVPNDTTFARRLLLSTVPSGGLLGRGTKSNNDARYIFCRKFL
jgi:hypothetical protein